MPAVPPCAVVLLSFKPLHIISGAHTTGAGTVGRSAAAGGVQQQERVGDWRNWERGISRQCADRDVGTAVADGSACERALSPPPLLTMLNSSRSLSRVLTPCLLQMLPPLT